MVNSDLSATMFSISLQNSSPCFTNLCISSYPLPPCMCVWERGREGGGWWDSHKHMYHNLQRVCLQMGVGHWCIIHERLMWGRTTTISSILLSSRLYIDGGLDACVAQTLTQNESWKWLMVAVGDCPLLTNASHAFFRFFLVSLSARDDALTQTPNY